eukprot:3939337-Rhodomonas_salina.1
MGWEECAACRTSCGAGQFLGPACATGSLLDRPCLNSPEQLPPLPRCRDRWGAGTTGYIACQAGQFCPTANAAGDASCRYCKTQANCAPGYVLSGLCAAGSVVDTTTCVEDD